MPRIVVYADSSGEVHRTPEAAAKADLVLILKGNSALNPGMVISLASFLYDHRGEVEAIFKEYDQNVLDYTLDGTKLEFRLPNLVPGECITINSTIDTTDFP